MQKKSLIFHKGQRYTNILLISADGHDANVSIYSSVDKPDMKQHTSSRIKATTAMMMMMTMRMMVTVLSPSSEAVEAPIPEIANIIVVLV